MSCTITLVKIHRFQYESPTDLSVGSCIGVNQLSWPALH